MASELVGGNSISLGMGLGLQAEPDTKGLDYAARGIQMDEARKQRAEAARKKVEDDMKELGIKAPVVHPLLQAETSAAVNSFGKGLYELTKSNDPDAYYKGKDLQASTTDILNRNIEGTRYLNDVERAMEQDRQSGIMTPESQEAFLAIREGNREKLAKIEDPTGRFVYDPATGIPHYRKAPNIKTSLIEKQSITDPRYAQIVGQYQNKEYVDPKGGVQTISINRMPETRDEAISIQTKFGLQGAALPNLEDTRDLLLQNADFVDVKTSELIKTGSLPRNFLKLAPEEQQQRFSDAVYRDLQRMNGGKATVKEKEPFAPKEGTLSSKDVAASLEVSQKYNIGSAAAGGSIEGTGETSSVNSQGTLTFKPTDATILVPVGTINAGSNTNVKKSGVQKKLNIGQLDVFPVFKAGPLKGTLVDEGAEQELKKLGKWNQEFVGYESMISGQGAEKEESELREGEISRTVPFVIPAKSVMGSLKTQKINLPFDAFEKKASDLTSKLPAATKKVASGGEGKAIEVTAAQADEAAKKNKMSRIDYLKAMKKAGHTVIIK